MFKDIEIFIYIVIFIIYADVLNFFTVLIFGISPNPVYQ